MEHIASSAAEMLPLRWTSTSRIDSSELNRRGGPGEPREACDSQHFDVVAICYDVSGNSSTAKVWSKLEACWKTGGRPTGWRHSYGKIIEIHFVHISVDQ